MAALLREITQHLVADGHTDVVYRAIGGSAMLERLQIEAAKARLSRLVITHDYRILLPDYNKEVELSPVHKAVYLLFLNHPEGIELKHLVEYRDELMDYYVRLSSHVDLQLAEDTIDRLVNPLDNAINEKCSHIKAAFTSILDPYEASYYIISSHRQIQLSGSKHPWYKRLKVITLPRHLYIAELKHLHE